VSLAYSTDGARTFQMYDGGRPLFSTHETGDSRDPHISWDAQHNRWVITVFWYNTDRPDSDTAGDEGAKFYTSTDLVHWVPATGVEGTSQEVLPWFRECPDLYQLPLDGNAANPKWVLQDGSGEYLVGSLDANSMFVPDPGATKQRMDQAPDKSWYASQTFNQNPTGDVVQMAWQMDNQGNATASGTQGGPSWKGDLSFPVKVELKTYPEGVRVVRNPIESGLATLRSATRTVGARDITTDPASDPLRGITADTYELDATFDVAGAAASTTFGFRLHQRADGSSDATVEYRMSDGTLNGMAMPPDGGKVHVHASSSTAGSWRSTATAARWSGPGMRISTPRPRARGCRSSRPGERSVSTV
jgi:fructan beta-fructosidase